MTQEYQDRLVAYVDILGWKQACETQPPSVLFDALQHIHQESQSYNESLRRHYLKMEKEGRGHVLWMFLQVRAAAFSDNLVVSMPTAFSFRIFSIADVCARLLGAGFLTRGGIALGKLYHEDNVVFGPALNRAVEIEKTTSLPRIVCDDNVIEYVAAHALPGYDISHHIVTDPYGKSVINLYSWPLDPTTFVDGARQIIENNWKIPNAIDCINCNIRRMTEAGRDKERLKWDYMRTMFKSHFFRKYSSFSDPYIAKLDRV